jgi:Kef-type K+ transport system membrane component KefB
MVLAGATFGPHGLHAGPKSHEVADFFADVGMLLLKFFAGLEIDLVEFRRTGLRALVFGLATLALPLATGTLVGLGFGYGSLGALLIGSLLASHMLLGYPIVQLSARLPRRRVGTSGRRPDRSRSQRVRSRLGVVHNPRCSGPHSRKRVP